MEDLCIATVERQGNDSRHVIAKDVYEGRIDGSVEIRLQGIEESLREGDPDPLRVFKMVISTENDGRVSGSEKELGGGSAAYELDAVAGRHIAQWGEEVSRLDGSVKSVANFIGKWCRRYQKSDDSDGAEEEEGES